MNTRQPLFKTIIFLSLTLLLAGAVQKPRSAWASMEDAAIFYEELSQHGEWVEYDNYGPVWYPTQVQENWRPYVDGRWTPAEEGYVFETQEPWGWATYHYGNWMPTEEYGWVWVPGRTWYPNTVTWRTSPESENPDASYIGWAPVPPPNYIPPPGYYPEGYYGGGPYRGPFESLITAPFWIFVKAASFLLGFSQPYSPAYSYWGCQSLVPPPLVPYYYHRTVIVHNYYTPAYYPRSIWAGRGYYNWGPPIPYVARVTRINVVNINNYVRQVNIYQRRNVAPPPGVLARRAYFREVLPPAMVEYRPLPRGERVRDVQTARANLVRPHLVKASVIKNVPAVRADIPKIRMNQGDSGQWRRGVPGAALPASALMPQNQQMENHVRKIPISQQIQPVPPQARKWQAPRTPGAGAGQPASFHQRRAPEPASSAAMAPRTAPPGGSSPRMTPGGPQGMPQAVAPGTPGAAPETPGKRPRMLAPEGVTMGTPSTSQAGAPPERLKTGKQHQPGPWSRQRPTAPAVAAPGQPPPGPGQQPRYTPGTPAPRAAAPVRVQPQPRPPAPEPLPPQQPKQPLLEQKQQQRQFQPQKEYTSGQSQGFWTSRPDMMGVQPRARQYPMQAPPQVQQQPAYQPRPQMRQQPFPQARPQVQQQSRPQPQLQVRPQPRPQALPQVRQQPPAQPRPQIRPQPWPQPQVRQQPPPQPQPQVSRQPGPQPQLQVRQQPQPLRPQAQNRPQAQPQHGRNKQVSEQP